MNGDREAGEGALAALASRLGELAGVQAPASVLPSVLGRLRLGDAYTWLESPIGRVCVAYNSKGIAAVLRASEPADVEPTLRARLGRPVYAVAEPPAWLVRALRHQLEGGARARPRFDLRGLSEFERAVLAKTLEIPRGEVRSYAWIAREIARPGAVRAVGTALGHNPVPIFLPCHRVIRTDGQVGDYVFGSAAKRALLAAEGAGLETLDALAAAGVRYLGSDTTRVYCVPACRQARRITAPHRVPFRSRQAALAAGYRPCRTCRPA